MNKVLPHRLSRRERQIMDILYRKGEAAVADVLEAIADPPSYSAIRAHLRILEDKGQVIHVESGNRYVYKPADTWTSVAKTALDHVVQSFFGGSVEMAVATLLSNQKNRPTDEELSRLETMIKDAKAAETTNEESGNE